MGSRCERASHLLKSSFRLPCGKRLGLEKVGYDSHALAGKLDPSALFVASLPLSEPALASE
jgi:hypothetical protein